MRHFLINGHRVEQLPGGLVEFYRYGVIIRLDGAEFNYEWAVRLDNRLSVLKSNLAKVS